MATMAKKAMKRKENEDIFDSQVKRTVVVDCGSRVLLAEMLRQ